MTPVGLAATASTSAVSAGLAAITATVLGIRVVQPPSMVPAGFDAAVGGAPFYLLVFGTVGGIVFAGIVAWLLLAPLGSTYRRGGLALVSAFATVMLMLVCMPVDRLLGKAGLAGLLALCSATAALLARRVRRATQSPMS